jgi:hypothetical protein
MVDVSRRCCGLRFAQLSLELEFRAHCEGTHTVLSLVLVGVVLLLELLCCGLWVWRFQISGMAVGVWVGGCVALGVAALTYGGALFRFFWPRVSCSTSQRITASVFRWVPVYAWLLATVLAMNSAVLALSVGLSKSEAVHQQFLLSGACLLPLGVHGQLLSIVARWRMVYVIVTGSLTFFPWLALACVYTGADGSTLGLTIASVFGFQALTVILSYMNEDQLRGEFALRQRVIHDVAAIAESDAKTAAVSHVSHELRTPLNSIILCVELLQSTGLEESQRRYLDNIGRAGRQLLSLVNDILDFAKLEAGELKLKQSPALVKDLIESALEIVSPLAIERRIELFSSFKVS